MKCECKEKTCTKNCERKHTHKGYSCEVCEPEAVNRIEKEKKKTCLEIFKETNPRVTLINGTIFCQQEDVMLYLATYEQQIRGELWARIEREVIEPLLDNNEKFFIIDAIDTLSSILK
jgi:hypothetical protein